MSKKIKIKIKEPGKPMGCRNGYLLFGIDMIDKYKKGDEMFNGIDCSNFRAYIVKLWKTHQGYEEDGYITKVYSNGKSRKILNWKKTSEPDAIYYKYKELAEKDKIRFDQQMKAFMYNKKSKDSEEG